MSLPVTTFYCDCCDFQQDSSHTWGGREYVLSDGVHIPLNWEIGWCQDCAGIAPIESLIEEPLQIELRKAKENVNNYSPAPVRYWWQLHRWIFASAWANRLKDWKSGREYLLGKVFDAENGLSLLKSRLSPPKCLRCGSLRVNAPLVISGEELDYPVSEPKRTGTLHPNCGGQLWMAQYGSRIALVPTVCYYTPEGECISKEQMSSSYNSGSLLETARVLTDEQAGGHGNRWGVFAEDTGAFFAEWLPVALENSQIVQLGVTDSAGQAQFAAPDQLRGVGLLYADRDEDAGRAGLLSLIAVDLENEETSERANQFWSAYPFFAEGIRYVVDVQKISLFPNRLEAWLELSVLDMMVFAFDTLFYQHRGYYTAETPMLFSLAALAYRMEPAPEQDVVIDDPEAIRRFRARQAWVEQHGSWFKEQDDAASLAAWQPRSPENLEPIRISMGHMTTLMTGQDDPADEGFYQGQVKAVESQAHVLFGVPLWRIDVVVGQPGDEEFILPFYVAESCFKADWRPAIGDYVTGTAWIQGYWVGEETEFEPINEDDQYSEDDNNDDDVADSLIQTPDRPVD